MGWGLPGMTYMGRRVLALPFIRTTSLPHEILHNWWGNAVDVAHGRGNWAEGLTTFQADLVQSALKNKDGGKSKRIEWLRNFQALPKDLDKAVNQFKSKTHDAAQVVGYGKTAFVFHMLKNALAAKPSRTGFACFTRITNSKPPLGLTSKPPLNAHQNKTLNLFSRPGLPAPAHQNLFCPRPKATQIKSHLPYSKDKKAPYIRWILPCACLPPKVTRRPSSAWTARNKVLQLPPQKRVFP
ncbi:MAG: hypothetical protein JKY92_04350 [Magnetovibrio sp.]|nr:hypothetical protein [Magnetovibrio sp.]